MLPNLLFISATPLPTAQFIRVVPQTCTRHPPRACTAKTPSTPAEVDNLFERLSHINKNMRKKASAAIAEVATQDEIDRLLLLLEEKDVQYRRAAVQTLGMTGLAAVPQLIDILASSDISAVRASCAKAIAAVALYFPEERANFPTAALDGLKKALFEDSDPVTRLSVIGCLGTLASDTKGEDGDPLSGCPAAVEVLIAVSEASTDLAVGASAVSAIAQIAQNGSAETKERVLEVLKEICNRPDSDDPESALNYVKEIAKSHIDEVHKVGSTIE